MQQFQRDVSFISKVFDENKITETCNGWHEDAITKTATFKELSRTDKSQHKLHFKIVAIFEHFGVKDADSGVKIDSDGLYDLTVKAVNTLLIIDTQFTAQDKAEFLNDSAAMFDFGLWLLGSKLTPFFSTFNKT